MHGAATARILVNLFRLSAYLGVICFFGLSRSIFIASEGSEPLFSKGEFKEYMRMGIPSLLTYWSGWLIFELQILAITNIEGISDGALAAGALWIQFEGSLASAQQGW